MKDDTGTVMLDFKPEQKLVLPLEKIDLIKRTICKDATNDELELFIQVCNRTQLDPFSRQVYAVKRWDSKLGREAMGIQVSIDGFRLVAQRSGEYAGQVGPHWCGEDGVWCDVWLKKEVPYAAKVGVMRRGFLEPIYSVAKWSSYAVYYKDKLSTMWSKFPDLMLAKVAEALSLRRAFPQELSGLYSEEEMSQSENVTDKSGLNITKFPNIDLPNISDEQEKFERIKKFSTEHKARLSGQGWSWGQIKSAIVENDFDINKVVIQLEALLKGPTLEDITKESMV